MQPRHPLVPLLTGALCLLVCCAASGSKRRPKPPVDRAVVAIRRRIVALVRIPWKQLRPLTGKPPGGGRPVVIWFEAVGWLVDPYYDFSASDPYDSVHVSSESMRREAEALIVLLRVPGASCVIEEPLASPPKKPNSREQLLYALQLWSRLEAELSLADRKEEGAEERLEIVHQYIPVIAKAFQMVIDRSGQRSHAWDDATVRYARLGLALSRIYDEGSRELMLKELRSVISDPEVGGTPRFVAQYYLAETLLLEGREQEAREEARRLRKAYPQFKDWARYRLVGKGQAWRHPGDPY